MSEANNKQTRFNAKAELEAFSKRLESLEQLVNSLIEPNKSTPEKTELVDVEFSEDYETATHCYRAKRTYSVPTEIAEAAIEAGKAEQAKTGS